MPNDGLALAYLEGLDLGVRIIHDGTPCLLQRVEEILLKTLRQREKPNLDLVAAKGNAATRIVYVAGDGDRARQEAEEGGLDKDLDRELMGGLDLEPDEVKEAMNKM